MGIVLVLVGVVGLVAGMLLPFLVGWPGGAVAIVLALVAIIFGFLRMKNQGKGKGSMIVGVLAIVIAVAMTVGSNKVMTRLISLAKEHADIAPIMSQYTDQMNPSLGFLGIANALPTDERDTDAVAQEMKELSKILEEETKANK